MGGNYLLTYRGRETGFDKPDGAGQYRTHVLVAIFPLFQSVQPQQQRLQQTPAFVVCHPVVEFEHRPHPVCRQGFRRGVDYSIHAAENAFIRRKHRVKRLHFAPIFLIVQRLRGDDEKRSRPPAIPLAPVGGTAFAACYQHQFDAAMGMGVDRLCAVKCPGILIDQHKISFCAMNKA